MSDTIITVKHSLVTVLYLNRPQTLNCFNNELLETLASTLKKLDEDPGVRCVVITGSEIYTGRIQDKFEPVIRAKMAQYPCEIVGVTVCDDDLDMIVDAAKGHLANGAGFLIFTGGMSVDPDDLTPLVAYLDQIPILGVPGAAISMPTTMLDVLLPQIFAGDRFTKADLIRLGDGGLCQLCKPCHFPNCTFGRY